MTGEVLFSDADVDLLTGGVESLDYQGVFACRQIASGCLDGYLPGLARQHAEEVVGVV